ncbi:competence type IV pilus minor pilin ComGD [Bacillus songklensis]|uniref:Competence type IV pilus minor pilin ComGD n=1 Tax=Bacillus songklensis TaxID=1069116 RepID=A0ABV8B0Z7_9BACI
MTQPQQRLHHNGFTVLEVLIVLAIVHAIMFVTIVKIEPLMEYYRLHWFMKQLETDIFYAQEAAITRGQAVSLRFSSDKNEYFIVAGSISSPLFTRSYDSRLRIQFATLGSQIKFLGNGNISKSGTFFISSGSLTYEMVFMLGKGRFYAEKL